MTYSAKIICDSINQGVRLTTMELVFPRIVLAEFNTHRAFSRNSASSRAIPIKTQIERVLANPYIPNFKRNQKGMQPAEELSPREQKWACAEWLDARDAAMEHCRKLDNLDVHKQWCNRLLEPFMWHTVIVTATEWENFFGLRCNPQAQDEIRIPAEMAEEAYRKNVPTERQMHTPFFDEMDRDALADAIRDGIIEERPGMAAAISTARCARVSYLTHDGRRDFIEDIALHDRLLQSRHMSPFEHVAVACNTTQEALPLGNFDYPWLQYRKTIPGERVAVRGAVPCTATEWEPGVGEPGSEPGFENCRLKPKENDGTEW